MINAALHLQFSAFFFFLCNQLAILFFAFSLDMLERVMLTLVKTNLWLSLDAHSTSFSTFEMFD